MKSTFLAALAPLALASCSLFAPAPPKYDAVKLADDLVVRDLVVPDSGPRAKSGDLVTIHYRGRLEDGTVFDSSYERGVPLTFELGAGQVPEGLDRGLVGLRERGRRKLVVPYALGYKEEGVPGIVPAYAKLIFDLELLEIGAPAL
ncbi:MAG: FKBP-type peptidyl-prolyl cis-trans isomerase [Planctomycetota bacterium]